MESLRIKISFIISCILHFLLLSGLRFVVKNEPVVISFPVELISLPSIEKVTEEVKKNIPQPKKEEVVIPKKVKPVPKKEVKKEEKKEEPKPSEQSPQEKVSQAAISPSVSLDSVKFPFTYYINQIRKKITEEWTWAQNYSGELKTVVYFKILRSGDVNEIKLKESSNNKLYDNICLRAVELSKPFPPLPEGYNEDYLGVYFEFNYRE